MNVMTNPMVHLYIHLIGPSGVWLPLQLAKTCNSKLKLPETLTAVHLRCTQIWATTCLRREMVEQTPFQERQKPNYTRTRGNASRCCCNNPQTQTPYIIPLTVSVSNPI